MYNNNEMEERRRKKKRKKEKKKTESIGEKKKKRILKVSLFMARFQRLMRKSSEEKKLSPSLLTEMELMW